MDSQGLEQIKQAFRDQNIPDESVEVTPIPKEMPKNGVRFLGIQTLNGITDRDVMVILKRAGLTPDKATEIEDLRLACLKSTVDARGHSWDLLLEDVSLHGDDSFDQLAREIYGVCRIDTLDLPIRQYNVLTKAKVETIGELLASTSEELLNREPFLNGRDIERIDEALVPFRLWVGYDHETPPY